MTPVLLVGAPLRLEGKLFNCAVVVYQGRVLGIVPKTYLPNYREFYEKRQFTSGRDAISREVQSLGQTVPFGNDLIFSASTVADFALHVEICEDVWTPIPPSTYAALGGSNGAGQPLRQQYHDRQGRLSAHALRDAIWTLRRGIPVFGGRAGESTTDLAWDGHALIYENNELLAEAERFAAEEQMITADIDLERLVQERMRLTSFNDTVGEYRERLRTLRRIEFAFGVPIGRGRASAAGRSLPLCATRRGNTRCALL